VKYVRLNITTEGQTEMEFVKRYLADYLVNFGVVVHARCVMTSKNKFRKYRGGLLDYQRAKNDIINWIKEEHKNDNVFFTTMFDLYALPNDFPNFGESKQHSDPYRRVEFLEESLANDINISKFVPYLQLHEFEALLLANPQNLVIAYFDKEKEIKTLEQLVATHSNNPELINTSPETAPSKRIIQLIPEYEGNKVTVGADLAGIDGIATLKQRCKHFGDWVTKLEQLNPH
jgi:Domain of unknown function (DUF4276)